MRRLVRLAATAAIGLVTTAHVGSPDAWFEGRAGAYPVTVHIEAPPVIPGIAVINVKVDGAERVTAYVNTFDAEGGTPPPDELVPADDRPGWRRARLWVMNAGSNRVTVDVHGVAGHGSVVVPLAAIAQRRLAFTPGFITMVVAGALILVAGMLTFIGAAVRESVLAPGAVPDEARRRRARISMMRGAAFIVLVLSGTIAWWKAEDRAFRERLYRPLSITTQLDDSSGIARFVLTIDDSTWMRRNDVEAIRARGELPAMNIIDDHGKVMHLFLLSEDGRSMAHLHPLTTDSVVFRSVLPPMPAGTYRVFGDIVQESGFTQTLTSTLVIPATARGSSSLSDHDDSWASSVDADSAAAQLADGTRLTWVRDPATLRAGEEAGLRFLVERPPNDTAGLEPYLGMPGHAAVVRDDGRVFIHLHPMGTISPAAQQRLSGTTLHNAAHGAPSDGRFPQDTLRFPYAFPEPGRYRVWIQVKRKGRILTGVFPADVQPRP
jgi:hypothetical protein